MKFITNKYDLAKPMNTSIAMPKNSEFMLNIEIAKDGAPAPVSPEQIWIIQKDKFEEPSGFGLLDRSAPSLVNDTDEDKIVVSETTYTYADSYFCINGKYWDRKWFQFKLPTDNFAKIYYLGDPEVEALGITYVKIIGQTQQHDVLKSYSFYPNGTIIDDLTGDKTTDYIQVGYPDNYAIINMPVLIPAHTTTSDKYHIQFGYYGHAQVQVRPYLMTEKGSEKTVADIDTIDATADKDYYMDVKQKQDKFSVDYTYYSTMAGSYFFTGGTIPLSGYEGTTIYADQVRVFEGWNGEIEEVNWKEKYGFGPGVIIAYGSASNQIWSLLTYLNTGPIWRNSKTYETAKSITIGSGWFVKGGSMQVQPSKHGQDEVFTRKFWTNDGINIRQNIRVDVKDVSEGSLEKPVPAEFTNFVTLSGTTTGGDEFSYEVPVKG